MRRNRKGTTRFGAIPECMAEVTPRRSRQIQLGRRMESLRHEGDLYRERAILGLPQPSEGGWCGVYSILAAGQVFR